MRSIDLWTGCVAGALGETEYRAKLEAAGFDDIRIEPTRIYNDEDAREVARTKNVPASTLERLDGKFMSAFVRAVKP
jgi:arsenite methyltransferase